jgi:hypothetical protein
VAPQLQYVAGTVSCEEDPGIVQHAGKRENSYKRFLVWCSLNLDKWWHLDLNIDWRVVSTDEGYCVLARVLRAEGLYSEKSGIWDIAHGLPKKLRAVRDDILKHRSSHDQ